MLQFKLLSGLAVGLTLLVLPAQTVRAEGPYVGQFELKDLESGAGYLQFQSQNAYSWGQPGRKSASDPSGETLFDENSVTRQRHALEMEMGLTRHIKGRIGIEYEKERIDDPQSRAEANSFEDLTLSEIGGEIIAILIPRDGDGFGFGVVVEGEHPIGGGEPNSVVMGPIFEFAAGPWSASFIPMAVSRFGGPVEDGGAVDNKWDFAYALQVMHEFSPAWSFGVEAYGTADRLGSTGHPSAANDRFGDFDQHRAGPIVYYTFALQGGAPSENVEGEEGSTATVGLGFFAGLNENTPDGTGKFSFEIDF